MKPPQDICKTTIGHYKAKTALTRKLLLILTIIFFSSCGSGLKVRQSRIRYFDSSFTTTVHNQPLKTSNPKHLNLTLLELLDIHVEDIDHVSISINKQSELEVGYLLEGKPTKHIFRGHFAKKGYYEFYLRNQRKEIPPFIPIFYSNNDIYRIRLALTTNGDLIVDNRWDKSGNVFILAGGSSGRRQSFFSPLKAY